jgi:hypothetical protein
MGCGASKGDVRGYNEAPMVIVRSGGADGLPTLKREQLSVPKILERLVSERERATAERRQYETALLLNFVRERRTEQDDKLEKFSYALGSLLGLHTLREAADLDTIPEILKPLEPASVRGVGEMAAIHAALKMKIDTYLATIASTQAAAKINSGLKRRLTGLANARLSVARTQAAASARAVGALRIEAGIAEGRAAILPHPILF